MEIELKLLIDPAQAPALLNHPLVTACVVATPAPQQLTSIYFDTPDLHLMRHGLGLRVRQVGQRWIQTLKNDGRVVAGLHQRNEWEAPVAQARPDLGVLLAQVQGTPWAGPLQAGGLADRLAPLFTTRFERTLRELRLPGGALVELALDRGELQCAQATQPISEVELELKSGEAADLLAWAQRLREQLPLTPSDASKAARGYAMVRQAVHR